MKRIKECPLLILFFLTCVFVITLKVSGILQEDYMPIEKVSASVVGIEEKLNMEKFEGDITSLSGNETEQTEEVLELVSENEAKKVYAFEAVDESYFSDAVFIGDSRTAGLMEYSKELGTPTFYAQVGLTIHNLLSKPFVETPEGIITIEEALTKQQFKKIYVMVGINELGRGTTQTYFEEYQRVIARIRELQPQAIIFVEAIMKVSEEKSTTDAVFNNVNITQRNEAIKTLENKNNIFYLDMNEVVTDENGNLQKDFSFDGVHLKAVYYKYWEEYLKQHGINIS